MKNLRPSAAKLFIERETGPMLVLVALWGRNLAFQRIFKSAPVRVPILGTCGISKCN
jgi:hypothetical protein